MDSDTATGLADVPLHAAGLELLSEVGDDELAAFAFEALSVPRTVENSFTLHAPLELSARLDLLDSVPERLRGLARLRILGLARGYLATGEAVPPAESAGSGSAADDLELLVEAISGADPDGADAAAVGLATRLTAGELAVAAAGALVTTMGAAGHAPILLAAYRRSPDTDLRPFRGTARRLAVGADLDVAPEWMSPPGRETGSVEGFSAALGRVTSGGPAPWGIFGWVSAAGQAGVMAGIPRLVDDDIDAGFRALFRVAALSMLGDDPEVAPYGWSHALTIPVGIREVLDLHQRRREALDVATLVVAGVRHAHGRVAVSGPGSAVAPEPDGPPIEESELVGAACIGFDGHLVKYVQACRTAAQFDPEGRDLYLRAADHLVRWWMARPPDEVA